MKAASHMSMRREGGGWWLVQHTLQVKILDAAVPPPERKTDGAGGYDVCPPVSVSVAPGKREKIPTGLAVRVPDGLALEGVDVVGGVDSDYRGEVAVLLHNTTTSVYHVWARQRIAQLVVVPVFVGRVRAVSDLG